MSKSVDDVSIRKIDYSEGTPHIGFLVIGTIFSIPPLLILLLFFGFPVSFSLVLTGWTVYNASIYGPKAFDIYKKNQKIEEINNKVVFRSPHEIIDNFMNWEENDEVVLNEYGSDEVAEKIYYFGVMDNGLLVFGKRSKMKHCDPEHVCVAPPEIFDVFEYENRDLQDRIDEEKLKMVKKRMKNSDYQEMLDEAKKELDSMEQSYLE